jgi:pyruvate dehydrogenase (quinone)
MLMVHAAMPSSITMEMAKGFTLYVVKAVISDRADEVIDLARTNLWRQEPVRVQPIG